MKFHVTKTYEELSNLAADFVVEAIRAKPESAVVFPTGKTPVGLYNELIARYRAGTFDPSQLRIFLLDDYVGIGPDDARSLYGWLQRELFTPLAIQPEQITPLQGMPRIWRRLAGRTKLPSMRQVDWIWPFWG